MPFNKIGYANEVTNNIFLLLKQHNMFMFDRKENTAYISVFPIISIVFSKK